MRKYYTLELIKQHHPELYSKTQTEQWQLSEQLLDLAWERSWGPEEWALRLGLPLKEYLSMEYGEPYISVRKYKRVIRKMQHIIKETE